MGVEAAFVLEEMSVAACSGGAVSYDSMEETRRVTIGVGCGGQEIYACMDTEVGGSFG